MSPRASNCGAPGSPRRNGSSDGSSDIPGPLLNHSQPSNVGPLWCWVMLCLLWTAAGLPPAQAAETEAAEYQIKAAFLCKFGNFVEWPADAGSSDLPFTIGVLGPAMVAQAIEAAARGQTVNGRPISVRPLQRGDPLDGLGIVFVARSHSARLGEVLSAIKDRPILTVTELTPGQATAGMINFVVVDDKVKFDVALPTASRNNLKISARLLGVARLVAGGPL